MEKAGDERGAPDPTTTISGVDTSNVSQWAPDAAHAAYAPHAAYA